MMMAVLFCLQQAKKRLSPRMSIRKSFSFRTRKKEHSPKKEKGNKR